MVKGLFASVKEVEEGAKQFNMIRLRSKQDEFMITRGFLFFSFRIVIKNDKK